MTSIIINITLTCTCGTCTASTLSLVFSTPGGLKKTKSTQNIEMDQLLPAEEAAAAAAKVLAEAAEA